MNYQRLANDFIKQNESVGYQSQPQMVAVRAFAEWLAQQEAAQPSVQRTADKACPCCGEMLSLHIPGKGCL